MANEPAWWQEAVFYQIYPRSFRDASGDGLGDLAGITQRVDYLAWLGIDAIWFSPLSPTPDVDLGYDISDYLDVDPRLGTLTDFDRMVAALHDRDIRVVLDLVPNHTSDRHPWFEQSRSGRDDPHHDWYVWRDRSPDGSRPNNWISHFGQPAWTFLDPPGRWYLHSFDPGQPDLNWDNPEVRAALQEAVRFWLRRGVDGFRVDVLWLLGKDPELRDNPPNPDWREGQPLKYRLLRVHSEGHPSSHERARLLRSTIDEFDDRVMIGEVVLPPERAVAYYGGGLDEAHFPHNFALTELSAWTADEVRATVDRYEALLPPGAWPNWLLGDHDFPRIASRVGPERARLAQMLLLTLRGTPTCYYGDELGLPSADFSTTNVAALDPQAANAPSMNRLVARRPMQWDAGPHMGFSVAEPWLPPVSEDAALTVEAQRDDPGSMLTLFRSLIETRRRHAALSVGSYRSLPAPSGVFSFERRHDDDVVQVHLNFGDEPHEVPGLAATWTELSTARRDPFDLSRSLILEAHEGVIAAAGPDPAS